MINNLDISSEAYHFLLYDVRDRYLKENKLKIKHAENYDDQRRAVLLLSPVEDYCFSAECRVKYLKKHFLGTGKYVDCGKCDLCKKAVLSSQDYFEEKDRITAILECITETREKFGKNTICDTLRGRYSKTVRSYRLYRAMTFALFHDVPRKDINRIINDLLEKNILRQTRGTYPTVSISPAGRNLFDLSEVSPLELPKRMEIAPGESVDFALIEKIRDFRRAQAKTLNLPAFMVFKDRVLKEIVQNNPHSKEELIRIKGFGDRSWNICGGALLKLLNTETSRTE
ncbi:MAG: hypothetical protein GY863_11020 [bacterium]|nr:hypothetical protein [bacterium]